MADIKSFPNNLDEFVGAEPLMMFLHGRTKGVYGGENNLRVVATESEMAVTVTQGVGWMSNSEKDGAVIWNDNPDLKLKIELADTSKQRIDRVVVSFETTDYKTRPTISILKGAAGSGAPALTNTDTMQQISLAQIIIPAGTIAIKASMVKDERLDESVCGVVTNDIKINTDGIQAQAEGFMDDMQKEFAAWFETIKDTLDGDTAGKLLNLINENASKRFSIKVPTSAWGDVAPYTQKIAVMGLTGKEVSAKYYLDKNPIRQQDEFKKITELETGTGQITITAKTFKPNMDLDIGIEVIG